MTALPIVMFPNKGLLTKTQPVTEFGEDTNTIVKNMIETIMMNNLVGLAANQVGINKSIFVIRVNVETPEVEGQTGKTQNFMAFLNPKVKVDRNSGKKWDWEGCGSDPGIMCLLERWNRVSVTAQNATDGSEFGFDASGAIARTIQHENDHLNGKLIRFIARQTKKV